MLLLEGLLAMLGSGLMAGAVNTAMMYSGRAVLGMGIGLGVQVAPAYLVEVAPTKWRGAFLCGFQVCGALGGVVSQIIVNCVYTYSWNWRLSLGFTAVPGAVLFLGMLFLSDSPSSLMARGHQEEAATELGRLRGVADISAELSSLENDIAREAARGKGQLKRLITSPAHRPAFIITITLGLLLNLYGNICVGVYLPELFRSVGLSETTSLRYNLIIALCKLVSAVGGMAIVDHVGRRPLLMAGCVDMAVAMFTTAGITAMSVENNRPVPMWVGTAILVTMCIFQLGYEGAAAPLTFALPSELTALEVRPPALAMEVACIMAIGVLMTFVALPFMCEATYSMFTFSGMWAVVMFVFTALLIPETNGVGMEQIAGLWASHRVWKKVVAAGPEKKGRSLSERGNEEEEGEGKPPSERAHAT